MSTAIPPNPNAIIRALLDIAQAAYVLIHSPSKEMGDNLRVQMALLEELPQYCNNPVNGPCRARKYLESFLVGGSTLTTIAADVQRDGIEFEAQVWKAPATGPGFTPTAEFPASGPISHDFYTHRSAWRDIIVKCIEQTKAGRAGAGHFREELDEDMSYLEHELRAFDRAFDTLPPTPALKPQANAVSGETERRMRPRFVEPDFRALQEQSNAWQAVAEALEKAMPGWRGATPRGMTSAVIAIEKLAVRAAEPNREQIRTNMLADTADEALRIINDADLLKNLVELFTMRDPGTSVRIYERASDHNGRPWRLDIEPAGDRRAARVYESTSLHQVIVVAHKGEQDREYPEPPL